MGVSSLSLCCVLLDHHSLRVPVGGGHYCLHDAQLLLYTALPTVIVFSSCNMFHQCVICCLCDVPVFAVFLCLNNLFVSICVHVFITPAHVTRKLSSHPFILPQPMEVYVDDDTKLTLHGLQQHYIKLQDREKNRKLFDLLDALEFNQVPNTL